MTKLPLTREDFEHILQQAAETSNVPCDDDTRIATINFFHSLDRNVCEYDFDTLCSYLRKAFSSKLTFDISREIDLKRRAENAEKTKLEVVDSQSSPETHLNS